MYNMKNQELAFERHLRRTLPGLQDIVAILFRRRMIMVVAFLLVILATIAVGLWVPKYDAHMKIVVSKQRANPIVTSSSAEPVQFSNDAVTEEDMNTEVELLTSEDLLHKVVLSTGLAGKPGAPDDPGYRVRVAKAVGKLYKDLTVEALHKSNVISVRYHAGSPEKGADVLKAVAAAYLEKHLESHRSSTELTFFDQQTQQYQQGLDKAQERLIDFTKGTGVVSADAQRDEALRQASSFDATAHQAQTEVEETSHRIDVLKSQLQEMKPRMTTVVRTLDNAQLLQQMKSTLLNLELKRTELLSKYEPSYRPVQELDQQIADTKSQIVAEEKRPLRDESSDQNPTYQSIQTDLIKAQAELSGLKARAAAAQSEASKYLSAAQSLDQSSMVQQDLKRAVKTQEENYLLYEHKREEARMNDALDQRGILNVAIAEPPTAPVLHNRSRLNLAFLTLLFAGTFSLASAFVADFVDPSFRTPEQLANYLDTPVLAALPKGGE
jgi:uncharacterized protein involved in exopolysaccharide biosynthesis